MLKIQMILHKSVTLDFACTFVWQWLQQGEKNGNRLKVEHSHVTTLKHHQFCLLKINAPCKTVIFQSQLTIVYMTCHILQIFLLAICKSMFLILKKPRQMAAGKMDQQEIV